MRRYSLNVLLAVLLLVYFLVTSGLGIFWVADQELPAFDLHYLFGYLTLLLVFGHVAINWKPLSRFVRRRAPAPLRTASGRRWRPALVTLSKLAALALFGLGAYWLGYSAGATVIEVGASAPQPASAPTASRFIAPQRVRQGDKSTELATYYHRRTKHSRQSILGKGGRLNWSRRPFPFKAYASGTLVPLPKRWVPVDMPMAQAIDAGRHPVLGLRAEPMPLRELSTILHLENGITKIKRYPRLKYYLRAAPSAGALYPTITYVLVRSVEGLEPGLYHYDVMQHALRLIRPDPELGLELGEQLARVSAHAHLIRGASAVLLFSTEYVRSSWKYHERAWRYCLLDAGHLAIQARIAAAALGWQSAPIGRFDDAKVNTLLDLDPNKEAALLLLPLGKAAPAPAAPREPRFVAAPHALKNPEVPGLITLAQGQTELRALPEQELPPLSAHAPVSNEAHGEALVLLPRDRPLGDAVGPTIERRRSERHWADRGLTLQELSAVLYGTFGMREGTGADPSVAQNGALRLYVIVLHVQGLQPGLYAYHRRTHALALMRPGLFRTESTALALQQKLVGTADVALIKTADTAALLRPDGSRGYRAATIDAGMVGGFLYRQALALGRGATGIGAFFDDEVSSFLGIDPGAEHILYMSAFGVSASNP